MKLLKALEKFESSLKRLKHSTKGKLKKYGVGGGTMALNRIIAQFESRSCPLEQAENDTGNGSFKEGTRYYKKLPIHSNGHVDIWQQCDQVKIAKCL